MKYTESNMNFDKLLYVLKNDYNSSNDTFNLMTQNILGFSLAILIQFLNGKTIDNNMFNQTLLKSSFWFLLIDNLIVNIKRNHFKKEKKEAFEEIHNISTNLKRIGINVEETDILHSIKERINKNTDYYYMIDMFNSIVPVSKSVEKTGIRKKTIIWEEGLDGYNKISFYRIGSITKDKEGIIKSFGEKDKINKEDFIDIKTFYELGYRQDEDNGIITFCKDNDDIRILSTKGDIENKSIKEKYLKIGSLLQSINYKDSYEINGIIKKKIHN